MWDGGAQCWKSAVYWVAPLNSQKYSADSSSAVRFSAPTTQDFWQIFERRLRRVSKKNREKRNERKLEKSFVETCVFLQNLSFKILLWGDKYYKGKALLTYRLCLEVRFTYTQFFPISKKCHRSVLAFLINFPSKFLYAKNLTTHIP